MPVTHRRKALTEPAPSNRRANAIGSERTSAGTVTERSTDALSFCRPIDAVVAMHPILFSEVLSQTLGRLSGLRVVSCDPGEEGFARIGELRPRVLVLDEQDLERTAGRLRHLGRILPTTRILVMAGQSSSARRRTMLRSGAVGIVEKGSGLPGLVRAIESAAAGKVEVTPSLGTRESEHGEAVRSRRPAFATDGGLTTREWEIAERVGSGLRNRDIALRLNISQETVKSHLNNIFRKLRLDGRIALGILVQHRIELKQDI